MNEENDYVMNGFANRKEYLVNLADEFGISYNKVHMFASILGESEDFDGLITTLEDHLDDM